MPSKKSKQKEQKLSELRKRAEAILAAESGRVSDLGPENLSNILHELHTYQIELELQNEELRQAQVELQKSQERYIDLYDFAPVGYVTVNEKGLIIEANITAADMLGMARGQLIRQPLSKFIGDEDQDLYYKHRREMMEIGKRQACELRMRRKDGTLFWVKLECSPPETAQKTGPQQLRIIIGDVTKRKQAEEALQKNHADLEDRMEERTGELKQVHGQLLHAEKLSAIGRLSASIAHEFNNPLYGIQSVMEGIRNEAPLNTDQMELINLALSECDRVKNLIRNLQDFNRPSSGRKEPIDIHLLIDSMITMVKKEYKNAHILIKKNYTGELLKIHAVADQVRQVFLNLLTNAKDAMEGNGGTVTIETERLDQQIAVHVSDTGSGIKPENISHIFEPFFSTKPAVKGTGLGLSISYGIIQGHGGNILVKSKRGSGTTFSIILPLTTKT